MNGDQIGQPSPEKICWVVELPDGRGLEFVHSEHCRVESGAVVFSNGTILDASLVAVYGPASYGSVYECYGCPHEADDEEDDNE